MSLSAFGVGFGLAGGIIYGSTASCIGMNLSDAILKSCFSKDAIQCWNGIPKQIVVLAGNIAGGVAVMGMLDYFADSSPISASIVVGAKIGVIVVSIINAATLSACQENVRTLPLDTGNSHPTGSRNIALLSGALVGDVVATTLAFSISPLAGLAVGALAAHETARICRRTLQVNSLVKYAEENMPWMDHILAVCSWRKIAHKA